MSSMLSNFRPGVGFIYQGVHFKATKYAYDNSIVAENLSTRKESTFDIGTLLSGMESGDFKFESSERIQLTKKTLPIDFIDPPDNLPEKYRTKYLNNLKRSDARSAIIGPLLENQTTIAISKAAKLLDLSDRQIYRLIDKARKHPDIGLMYWDSEKGPRKSKLSKILNEIMNSCIERLWFNKKKPKVMVVRYWF